MNFPRGPVPQSGDTFDFNRQPRAPEAPPATSGRQRAQADRATVALAISGMSFYWMMPMMAGRKRRRRPRQGPSPNGQRPS